MSDTTEQTIPAVGDRVEFREDTPQFAKNQGTIYVVVPTPLEKPYSTDENGRPYVWLTDEQDLAKPPSRQRGRSGWADALRVLA